MKNRVSLLVILAGANIQASQSDSADVFYDAQQPPSCTICLRDEIKLYGITQCGHSFCDACIRAALQIKSACPCCRKTITTINGECVKKDTDNTLHTDVEHKIKIRMRVLATIADEGYAYAEVLCLVHLLTSAEYTAVRWQKNAHLSIDARQKEEELFRGRVDGIVDKYHLPKIVWN